MDFKENLDKNEKDLKNSSESKAIDEGALDSVAGGLGDVKVKLDVGVDVIKRDESENYDKSKSLDTAGGSIGGDLSF